MNSHQENSETWTNDRIEFTLVNGIRGDPAVYGWNAQQGEAFLLDLGSIDNLTHRQIMRISTVCVSHTHMDHFIGFDKLLRARLQHNCTITFCGPTGLAENIRHRVLGYTWNLIEKDQIKFRVVEIDRNGTVCCFSVESLDGFDICKTQNDLDKNGMCQRPRKPAAALCLLSDGTRIDGVCLDHGIDSVAFLIQQPQRYNFIPENLLDLDLKPGKWMSELQKKLNDGLKEDLIEVDSKSYKIGDLANQLLKPNQPTSIGYCTDLIYSEENLNRLQCLMRGADEIICEANYRPEDEAKATANKHLTTEQAAKIAAALDVRSLRIFHVSQLYHDNPELSQVQAEEFFRQIRAEKSSPT